MRLGHKTLGGFTLSIVLLGIVLLAALSAAITATLRGGGNSSGGEKAVGYASEILQYARAIDDTVARLQLDNECLDTQINFANSVVADYTNANAPASGVCDVFGAAGGGLVWAAPQPQWLAKPPSGIGSSWTENVGQWFFTGDVGVLDQGTSAAASTGSDLVMYLPFITQAACQSINQTLGIAPTTTITETVTGFTAANADKFATAGYVYAAGGIIGNENHHKGLSYGCVERNDAGANNNHYGFYYVLLAR